MVTNYRLEDHEANVIVPMLCEKSGNNNSILKNKIKTLIKHCLAMYDHHKCISLIIDFISTSKNPKSMAECLEEISLFIEREGFGSVSER